VEEGGEERLVDNWAWYYRAQRVVSADGDRTYDVIGRWDHGDMIGLPYPAVLGWTPDSRSVYLFEKLVGGALFGAGSDLRRFDVEDGSLHVVEPQAIEAPLTDAALGRLVYSRWGEVVVRELSTGREWAAPEPGRENGAWVWSPDGRAIAFTFTSESGTNEGIARFDIAEEKVTILHPPAIGSLRVVDWLGESVLSVRSEPSAYSATKVPSEVRSMDAATGADLGLVPPPR
jgi:hypothetical protein